MGDSMSTIINATTTNGVVIQPDNSGSLVLQTNSGTTALTIDTSQNATFAGTLTATGKLVSSSMPTGSVLQVVQGTTNTNTTITSTTYADTTLTASITPSASSSKILVIVSQSFLIYRETTSAGGKIRIVRSSTSIAESSDLPAINAATAGGSVFYRGNWGMSYLDSPSTTSSTTYKTQAAVFDTTANNHQIRLQQDGTKLSTIILMEIAA
jgi:hypothetical protein